MVKIWVNKDTCIACGTCMVLAPEIFDWDSDGKSKAKVSETNDPNLIQKAKDAAIACPTHSINVEE
ncbi:MAG: ferredoxin [Nanopusillaceae archaeon]